MGRCKQTGVLPLETMYSVDHSSPPGTPVIEVRPRYFLSVGVLVGGERTLGLPASGISARATRA